MENQIYGLSVHTLAGESEDILPYYLETSMSWQNGVIRSQVEPFFPTTKHTPQPPLVQHIQILCITLGILMQQQQQHCHQPYLRHHTLTLSSQYRI